LQSQLADAEREAGSAECGNSDVPAADRDAAVFLSGGGELPPTDDTPSVRAWRKVYALRRAIELQRVEVARERQNASEKICVEARPRYQKILAAQAQAVEALVKAHRAEAEFREQLTLDDVSFTHWIRPAGFLTDRDLTDDSARWFKELKESGYKV
jgi:hypothetical protein